MKSSFCLCLICIASHLSAQQQWILTGLTDSIISICAQNNLIWMATEDSGIKSFDKQTGDVEVYNVASGDMNSNDFRVVKYSDGRIYAGAFWGGYSVFENGIWTHFDTSNSLLPGMNVTDFAFDEEQHITWVATNAGLVKIEDDTWEIMDSLNSELAGTVLTCLLYDDFNQLWIGTRYAGLSKYADGTYTTYNYDNSGISDNMIRTLACDAEGDLYVSDYYGVGIYDPFDDVWEFVLNTTTASLTSNQVNRMAFDLNGHLWFVSHYGVTHWDMEYFYQYYTSNSPLQHNTTDGLCVDDENMIWIGSFGGLIGYNEYLIELPAYESEFYISPNPFHNQIRATIKNGEHIALYDITGTSVYESTLPMFSGEYTVELYLPDLPGGVYFLKVEHGGDALVERIVKM